MLKNDMKETMLKNEDMFLQNVFHKFNTRLMVIEGASQGLSQGVISPEEADSVIRGECGSLAAEINEFLTFSRLSFSPEEIALTSLPLTEILENVIDRFSSLAKQSSVSFAVNGDHEDFPVIGSEDLLETILDNLISNALRYAKKTITVSITEQNDLIRLTVADDGDGIAEEDLPHLFERFYKGKNGHLGLGLAISSEAARLMGGALSAENGAEGAAFTLCLRKA